jgi:hypothetical protein
MEKISLLLVCLLMRVYDLHTQWMGALADHLMQILDEEPKGDDGKTDRDGHKGYQDHLVSQNMGLWSIRLVLHR